jgi:hypothetical protein
MSQYRWLSRAVWSLLTLSMLRHCLSCLKILVLGHENLFSAWRVYKNAHYPLLSSTWPYKTLLTSNHTSLPGIPFHNTHYLQQITMSAAGQPQAFTMTTFNTPAAQPGPGRRFNLRFGLWASLQHMLSRMPTRKEMDYCMQKGGANALYALYGRKHRWTIQTPWLGDGGK